ncbi:MAG: DUF4397 domain-containing protein [Phycisphaerales bacterium]|nr:DUF4397 domain-containing protein [Phycisphaerales bacterium]
MNLSLRLGAVSLCGLLATSSFADDARVRVVHASPDAPAVDVLVDGSVAFSNLAFTESTMYAALPEGTYDVNVTAAGDPGASVIEAMVMLDADTDYSVVAVNTLANIEPLVLVDDNTRDPDNARIRFVHASPDAPAVDIALAGGDVLFGDIEFKEIGDYLAVPGGTYDLEVRLAGTNAVVLPLPGIQVSNDTVYTVFAMGFAFDQPALQAVVTIDAGPIPLPGDLNGNGMVDGKDLGLLLEDWGRADSPADLNGDGTVDGQDLGLLLANWS